MPPARTIGDATEVDSSAQVYGGCVDLPIGSLKSNTGHLITAAGVAGLIKVIEAMRHEVRPPTLHVDHPLDALAGSPFRVLDRAEPWRRGDAPDGILRAGVSAFGFGGNNAHLIVEEPASATALLGRSLQARQENVRPGTVPGRTFSGRHRRARCHRRRCGRTRSVHRRRHRRDVVPRCRRSGTDARHRAAPRRAEVPAERSEGRAEPAAGDAPGGRRGARRMWPPAARSNRGVRRHGNRPAGGTLRNPVEDRFARTRTRRRPGVGCTGQRRDRTGARRAGSSRDDAEPGRQPAEQSVRRRRPEFHRERRGAQRSRRHRRRRAGTPGRRDRRRHGRSRRPLVRPRPPSSVRGSAATTTGRPATPR